MRKRIALELNRMAIVLTLLCMFLLVLPWTDIGLPPTGDGREKLYLYGGIALLMLPAVLLAVAARRLNVRDEARQNDSEPTDMH